MLLNEFFGKAIEVGKKLNRRMENDSAFNDDLFWFIVDNDRLHKDYFFPLAKKIKKLSASGKLNKEKLVKEFMPMVEKGCKEFYEKNKMQGKLGKVFPKKIREELCDKLYEHFYDDIVKDTYNLG